MSMSRGGGGAPGKRATGTSPRSVGSAGATDDAATSSEGSTGAADADRDGRERDAAARAETATTALRNPRSARSAIDALADQSSATASDDDPRSADRDDLVAQSPTTAQPTNVVDAFGDFVRNPNQEAVDSAFDRPGMGGAGLLGRQDPQAGLDRSSMFSSGDPALAAAINAANQEHGGVLPTGETPPAPAATTPTTTGEYANAIEQELNELEGKPKGLLTDVEYGIQLGEAAKEVGASPGTMSGGGTASETPTYDSGLGKAYFTQTGGADFSSTDAQFERMAQEKRRAGGGVGDPGAPDLDPTSGDGTLRAFLGSFDGGDAPRAVSRRAQATNPSPEEHDGGRDAGALEPVDARDWVGQPRPGDDERVAPDLESFGTGRPGVDPRTIQPSPDDATATASGPEEPVPDVDLTPSEGAVAHLAPGADDDTGPASLGDVDLDATTSRRSSVWNGDDDGDA